MPGPIPTRMHGAGRPDALARHLIADVQIGDDPLEAARRFPYLGPAGEEVKRHPKREWAPEPVHQQMTAIGRLGELPVEAGRPSSRRSPVTGSTRSGTVVASASNASSSAVVRSRSWKVAICDRFPAVSSMCGSIGASGTTAVPSGAPSASSDRPSRDHRAAAPGVSGSPPSTSRTTSPATWPAVPVSASATQTPMPSPWSTVNARRRPSGAQAGTLTRAPSGSCSACCVPSASRRMESPVSGCTRWRPASTGSTRIPASDRYGLASCAIGGCAW